MHNAGDIYSRPADNPVKRSRDRTKVRLKSWKDYNGCDSSRGSNVAVGYIHSYWKCCSDINDQACNQLPVATWQSLRLKRKIANFTVHFKFQSPKRLRGPTRTNQTPQPLPTSDLLGASEQQWRSRAFRTLSVIVFVPVVILVSPTWRYRYTFQYVFTVLRLSTVYYLSFSDPAFFISSLGRKTVMKGGFGDNPVDLRSSSKTYTALDVRVEVQVFTIQNGVLDLVRLLHPRVVVSVRGKSDTRIVQGGWHTRSLNETSSDP